MIYRWQLKEYTATWYSPFIAGVLLGMVNLCFGVSLEQQGIQALKDRIPEVAAARFADTLQLPDLSPEVRKRVTRQLVEARVRAGQHEEALEMFAKQGSDELEDCRFWKGIALAALGFLGEAEKELAAHASDAKATHYEECLISLARVQANRGDLRSAVVTLNRVPQTSSNSLRARIDQCHLYLLMDQAPDARKVLPLQTTVSKSASFEIRLLNARILLSEKQPDAALNAYATLRKDFTPTQVGSGFNSRTLLDDLHLCAVGEARARHALGKVTEATDNLLAFLQNNPQSPLLAEAFAYLSEWIPNYNEAAEDPVRARVLERLEEWSPLHKDRPYPLIAGDEESVVGINIKKNTNAAEGKLHAHALHARIIALGKAENSAAVDEMRRLVFAMQAMHPGQLLTYESWLLWTRSALARDDRKEVLRVLDFLVNAASGIPQVNATVLLARESFLAEDFSAASEWFGKAADALRSEARRAALFNSAIAALNFHNTLAFDKINANSDPKLRVNLTLEKALSIARIDAAAALPLLDHFLANYPQHKRTGEARLALAQCAMRQSPADLVLAKSQLESIDESMVDAEFIALAWIQLAHFQMHFADVTTRCRKFLQDFPDSSEQGKIRLNLGVSLYQTGDYGEARVILQKLAADLPMLAGPATMFAARAAARSGTPESITEAGVLFNRVAAMDSPLARPAVIEKARVFIDTKVPENVAVACEELTNLVASSNESSSHHIPAYLMLMECHYALGATDSQNYSKALSLQRKLLDHPHLSLQDRYHVFYYRGLSLEQLGKESEAIDSYYQVIESASNTRPSSWEYIDRCTFNALAILEKNKSWESAIALARKIAALQGPRAKEAEERARRLTLEHFIFDQ